MPLIKCRYLTGKVTSEFTGIDDGNTKSHQLIIYTRHFVISDPEWKRQNMILPGRPDF